MGHPVLKVIGNTNTTEQRYFKGYAIYTYTGYLVFWTGCPPFRMSGSVPVGEMGSMEGLLYYPSTPFVMEQ